jgi:PPK2 family polyphosphate:nucleotide phosphotransferase
MGNILDVFDADGLNDWDKQEKIDKTEKNIDKIAELINLLYAEKKQSVLLVLQGMDASGKDGLTREIFKKISPTWVKVCSFKKPTDEEFAHDFLWRIHKHLPEKGMVQVFNRSHYEDILVPSVYGYLDKKTIQNRYKQINDFEEMLEENGTKIIKIYLNVSYEKQEEKLLERINLKEKHWKHSDNDWATREHWNEFMEVYEDIFKKCDNPKWHIVACNRNWTKNYEVSEILLETLEKMNPQFPDLVSEKFTPDYK